MRAFPVHHQGRDCCGAGGVSVAKLSKFHRAWPNTGLIETLLTAHRKLGRNSGDNLFNSVELNIFS